MRRLTGVLVSLIVLGFRGFLAVRIGIQRPALRQGHVQPPRFVSGFQLGTASGRRQHGQRQRQGLEHG
jgi:hypothetical protein